MWKTMNKILFMHMTSSSKTEKLLAIPSTWKMSRTISTGRRQLNAKFNISDQYEFDKKVINSEKPVVVNFHAEWCHPCKILTPKLIELLEPATDIDLAIIDVDNNTDLVEIFELRAVPAVLVFRNGVVIDKFIGLTDATSIENFINKLKAAKK